MPSPGISAATASYPSTTAALIASPMLSTVTSVPALIQSTVPPAASIFGLTASYPAFTCAKNGLFSIAMIAILTGAVGFVVLNAGRSPCGGAVGGADSMFEECFTGVSWAVVHPASNAIAATAKVIARFTGTPCRSACRPRVSAATSIGRYRAGDKQLNRAIADIEDRRPHRLATAHMSERVCGGHEVCAAEDLRCSGQA